MDPLVKEMIAYLRELIGLDVVVHLRSRTAPVFISEAYFFYGLRIGSSRFLGVIVRHPENFKLAAFEKHQRHFSAYISEDEYEGLVLIADHLPGIIRSKLVEKRIPFIIPKGQLYWPDLGIEFRAHVRKQSTQKSAEKIDPSTQAVLIGVLNGLYPEFITPTQLADRLHYSLMSMTRSLDVIESLEIGKITKQGRSRFFLPPEDRKSLWKKIRPLLINPVREAARFSEQDVPDDYKLLAGESALSEMSSLVEPQTSIYAVDREKWKKIKNRAIRDLQVNEPGTCEVQVWRYDPELFSDKKCVDVFSLYLSLGDNKDERIGVALDQALEDRL